MAEVYPNPFTDKVTVDISNDNSSYNIRTIEGKLIRKGNLVSGKNLIILNDLSQGMYRFEILTNNNSKSLVIVKN